MGRESRRATRRPMSGTVLVTDTMTEEVIGRIGNLSASGLLLINRDWPACAPAWPSFRLAHVHDFFLLKA